MNYEELLAENDKNLAKIEALEAQLKPANLQQFLTFALIDSMSTKQIDEVFTYLHESNVNAMAKEKANQERITQLTEQIEELKSHLVDALGDGFYDGYWKCVEHAKDDNFDSFDINEVDVLEQSEEYESEHRYSKSIADIRAKAGRHGFMTAINLIRLRPERANHAVFVNDEAEKYANTIRLAAQGGEA